MKRRVLFLIWAALLGAASTLASGPIHLKTRDLTASNYPAAEALQTVFAGPAHLLVQFSQGPSPADLHELEFRGARVVGSAPDGGITISITHPISFTGLAVEWSGPLLAQDKLSPLLSQAGANGGPAAVVIEFHPDVHKRRALELLAGVNAQVLSHPDLLPNHLLVTAAPAVLAQIAGFDEVAYIFPASADLIQGNRVMACNGAEMAAGTVGQYVLVGNGWPGAGTGLIQLEYVFNQMSAKLPVTAAQSENPARVCGVGQIRQRAIRPGDLGNRQSDCLRHVHPRHAWRQLSFCAGRSGAGAYLLSIAHGPGTTGGRHAPE